MASNLCYEISTESYGVKEFIDRYKSNFEPKLIKVEEGYETLWSLQNPANIWLITNIKSQHRVVLKCDYGRYMSIPVTHPLTFNIVTEEGILPEEHSVNDLLEKAADFPVIVPCYHGQSKTLHKQMEVVNTFEEKLMVGYTILEDNETDSLVLAMRSPIKFRIVTDMKSGRLQDHIHKLLTQRSTDSSDLKEYQDIIVHKGDLNNRSECGYTSCAKIDVYGMLKSWRQRKCTPPHLDSPDNVTDEDKSPQRERICECLPLQYYTDVEKSHLYVNVPYHEIMEAPSTTPREYANVPCTSTTVSLSTGNIKTECCDKTSPKSCQNLIPADVPAIRKSEINITLQTNFPKYEISRSQTQPLYVNLGRSLIQDRFNSSSSGEEFGKFEHGSKHPIESQNKYQENECKYHRELYEKSLALMRVMKKIKKEPHSNKQCSSLKCTSCKKGSKHGKLYNSVKLTMREVGAVYGTDSSPLSSSSSDDNTSDCDEDGEVFYDANERRTKVSLDFDEYCRRYNIDPVKDYAFGNEQQNEEYESNKYITMKRMMIPSYIQDNRESPRNPKPNTIGTVAIDNSNTDDGLKSLSSSVVTSKTLPLDAQTNSNDASKAENRYGLPSMGNPEISVNVISQSIQSQNTGNRSVINTKAPGETVLQTLDCMFSSKPSGSDKRKSRKTGYNSIYLEEYQMLEKLLQIRQQSSSSLDSIQRSSRTTDSTAFVDSDSSCDEATSNSNHKVRPNTLLLKSVIQPDKPDSLSPLCNSNKSRLTQYPCLRKLSEPSYSDIEDNRKSNGYKERRSIGKTAKTFLRRSKTQEYCCSKSDDEMLQNTSPRNADRKCKLFDQDSEQIKLKLIGELEEYNDNKYGRKQSNKDEDKEPTVDVIKESEVKDITVVKKKKGRKFSLIWLLSRKSESNPKK